jgi:hypothetical protein
MSKNRTTPTKTVKSKQTKKKSKSKSKKTLKKINNFKFKNEYASIGLFIFSFVFIFVLSLFAVKEILPQTTVSYAKEVPPPVAAAQPSPLPSVPNEAKRRVSIPKQSAEVTEHVKKRICEVFPDNCQEALVIALHESGYNIKAQSSSSDSRGVFQIHCPSHRNKVGGDCNKLYDLETNLKIAHDIFARQGWSPWSTKVFLKNLNK